MQIQVLEAAGMQRLNNLKLKIIKSHQAMLGEQKVMMEVHGTQDLVEVHGVQAWV